MGQNGYAINLPVPILDKELRRNPSSRATMQQLTQDAWVSSFAVPFLLLEHYLEPMVECMYATHMYTHRALSAETAESKYGLRSCKSLKVYM